MSEKSHVVVIGAGVAGLFATYRLLKRGLRVTLCEASDNVGGVVGWTRVGDAVLERYYHHFFLTDDLTIDTLETLGIPMTWNITRTGFVGPGPTGVMELSAPHHLLTYPGLSVRERVSLGAILARVQLTWKLGADSIDRYDDVSVEEWLSQWGGRAAYHAFFDPLIRKKFGKSTPTISAAWIMGRLTMRAGRTREGEKLGYPTGSYKRLTQGLADACKAMGATIRTGDPVTGLKMANQRVVGVSTKKTEHQADYVISTMSPPNHARLCRSAGFEAEAKAVERVPIQGAIVILLGLERRLSEYYWVNVMDPQAPFGALIEQTLIRPDVPYGGPTLYVASYPDEDDPMWDMDDDAIVEQALGHLRRLFPETMRNNGVRWSEVARTRQAGLLYHCGVKRVLPSRRSSIDGLFFTGMFRCYPRRPVDLVGADACACADVVASDALGLPEPDWTDTHLPKSLDP